MNTSIISSTPDQYQVMLENYASILEKTNSQLGLWTNPYGVMVGTLTLLVAVGAIIVSVMLVRNSREQKEMQQEFFKEQERLIKEKDVLAQERFTKSEEAFESLIEEQQGKLAKENEEGKKKIQDTIDELKKEKAKIGIDVYDKLSCVDIPFVRQHPLRTLSFGSPNLSTKEQICNACGKSFYHTVSNMFTFRRGIRLGDSADEAYCSHCGAKNIVL